jgi:hypothetical protein
MEKPNVTVTHILTCAAIFFENGPRREKIIAGATDRLNRERSSTISFCSWMMLDVPLVQILAGYLSYKIARGQAGIPGYIFSS